MKWRIILISFFLMGSALGADKKEEGETTGKKEGYEAYLKMMAISMMLQQITNLSVAAFQAGADESMASINAGAQVRMTEISASVQREANNLAADTAQSQSRTAKQVAILNNNAVTERLGKQLASLADARGDAQQAERERRQLDENYNQQRIALAQKQSDQNLALAKDTLAAQLSEAGLRTGFSTSSNSGSALSVTQTVAKPTLASRLIRSATAAVNQ